MKFLTGGQRLKEIRKFLKMSQEDLVDESITRGLISMIEIGKRQVSPNVAIKIVEKLNKRAKELDIELKIDNNFLLRSVSEEAELYCLKKLEEIHEAETIKEVIEIADKYNLLNIKALYDNKMGDYYFDKNYYNKAFFYYNKSIDMYKSINKDDIVPALYLKLGHCKAMMLSYLEALPFFSISERYSKIYDDKETEKIAIYNISKCYLVLNNIELALVNVEKFLSLNNKKTDYDIYVYANIIKANCFELNKNFDGAIQIYNSLLEEYIDSNDPVFGYIYNNLGVAYLNKDDFSNSLKYFNKAEQLRIKTNSVNLCHTIIEKSDIFIKQGFYKDALELIELGLKQAKSINDYEYLIKGNCKLAYIYEGLKDYSSLKQVYLSMIHYFHILNNYNEMNSIYVKLSLLSLNENNIDEAKKFLLMSQKKDENVAF